MLDKINRMWIIENAQNGRIEMKIISNKKTNCPLAEKPASRIAQALSFLCAGGGAFLFMEIKNG